MKNNEGKRATAGRPKKAEEDRRVTTTISLSPKIREQLDAVEGGRSAKVKAALIDFYGFSE